MAVVIRDFEPSPYFSRLVWCHLLPSLISKDRDVKCLIPAEQSHWHSSTIACDRLFLDKQWNYLPPKSKLSISTCCSLDRQYFGKRTLSLLAIPRLTTTADNKGNAALGLFFQIGKAVSLASRQWCSDTFVCMRLGFELHPHCRDNPPHLPSSDLDKAQQRHNTQPIKKHN